MSFLILIDRPFIVIDAWQSVGFAKSALKTQDIPWIVIFRRHPEGLKWYLLTRPEFEAKAKSKRANLRIDDALQLQDHLASEVFFGTAPKETSRPIKELELNSANRVVIIDPQTGTVKALASLADKPLVRSTAKKRAGDFRHAPAKKAVAKKSPARKELSRESPRPAIAGRGPAQRARLASVATPTSLPKRPSSALKNEPYTLVPVYFGTDRQPITKAGKSGFGDEREPNGKVNLGRCQVTVPVSHGTGELESPKWYRLEFRRDPQKHLSIWETTVLKPSDFYGGLASHAQASSDKSAFIFIHGFNVTFEDAIYRTGQMAHDLSFLGAAILFSWPSRGKFKGYLPDEATINSSSRHFKTFLDTVLDRSGAEVLHIIAHSMGNRILLGALEKLAGSKQTTKLHNIILAAPDVDKQDFEESAEIIHTIPKRLTLYASSKDKALRASQAVHDAPRAGEAGKNLITLPYLDTIDASGVDTDFLGHSVALADRSILGDVFELLRRGTAPEGRFGLQKISEAVTGPHWAFRK